VSVFETLPNTWQRVRLSHLAQLVGGGTPSRTNSRYFNGDILWATPTDLTNNNSLFLSDTAEKISKEGLRDSSAYLLPIGSVLMTSRATIGLTALNTKPTATNQGFANFIPNTELLNAKFLAYKLQNIREKIIRLASGSTFLEVSRSTLSKLELELPPMLEQERIVAILEQAKKVDQLFAEFFTHFETAMDTLFQVTCQVNKSTLRTLESLNLDITTGSTPPAQEFRSSAKDAVPFIKVNNIMPDGSLLLMDENNFVSKKYNAKELKRSIGKPNDVIMNIVGPPMGKIGFLTNQYPEYNMNQAIALIRANSNIEPLYLFFALRSQNTLKQINAFSKMARQVNLNQASIRQLQIPIISPKAQKHFADTVIKFFQIRGKFLDQQKDIEILRTRIFDSAFSGLLTQQWRAMPDIAPRLEQQAQARDLLLAGAAAVTEEVLVLDIPDLSTQAARARFGLRVLEIVQKEEKIQLQTSLDVVPAQFLDAFLGAEFIPKLAEQCFMLSRVFSDSSNPDLQGLAEQLEKLLDERHRLHPDNPENRRRFFWRETDRNSPMRQVYNAMRVGLDYTDTNSIQNILDSLGTSLERYKIEQALGTLEAAGLVLRVLLEIPLGTDVVQVVAYRLADALPAVQMSATIRLPSISARATAIFTPPPETSE
jgi:type I restriction enzyme, S subunit